MAKKKPKKILIGAATYILLFAGATAGLENRDKDDKCGGVERWKVKVAADPDRMSINATPIPTTIDSLDDVKTDMFHIKTKTPRLAPERQVYRIDSCFISDAILESDNDIHLVIEDGKGRHMIAEIPDPSCPAIKKSRFFKKIKKAREEFMSFEDTYNKHRFNITGVFFIDKEHSGHKPTGNNPNNVELHPVIKFEKFAPDDSIIVVK